MKYTGLIRYYILNQFPAFTDSVGNKWGALDIIDGAIIDWILDFFPRAKKETKDGVVYMFVSNSYLITDMPVLGIRSDRAIRARVERMVAHGVLVRWHKDKTEQYLAVTKRWADKEWVGRNETSEGSERNFRVGRNETSDNPPTSYPLSNPQGVKSDLGKSPPTNANLDQAKEEDFTLSAERAKSLWNEFSEHGIPPIRTMTIKRAHGLSRRVLEGMDLAQVLGKAKMSDFLTGKNDRGWKMTLDWLIENDTNWVKVMEGKYDNRPAMSSVRAADREIYK